MTLVKVHETTTLSWMRIEPCHYMLYAMVIYDVKVISFYCKNWFNNYSSLMPSVWNEYELQWNTIYSDSCFNYNVQCPIMLMALYMPIVESPWMRVYYRKHGNTNCGSVLSLSLISKVDRSIEYNRATLKLLKHYITHDGRVTTNKLNCRRFSNMLTLCL